MSSLEPNDKEYFSYSPYGCNYRNKTDQSIGFQNMWTDEDDLIIAENGRTYAPWIGRFLQRDQESPFGDSGIDSYVFGENSPVMAGDPTGFTFWIWQWPTVQLPTVTVSTEAAFTARAASSSLTAVASTASFMKVPNIVPGVSCKPVNVRIQRFVDDIT